MKPKEENKTNEVNPYRFLLYILSVCFCLSSCVVVAPPSPLVTYGGPKTTPKLTSEAALGVGTGVALFDGAHSGATGYFGRFKFGVSEKLDLGIDFSGASRNDGQYLAAKLATRYQLTDRSRFEFAIGAADDSDGKSLNTDMAYTIGTIKDRPWNFYSSLRLAYAKGYPGNAITLPGQASVERDSVTPPDTFFALVNLGAQGRISENQKIIFEAGYGYIFPKETKSGPAFYISTGLLFNFGKRNKNR